jgi:2-polyprenyl-3-methyl-5-hydroxy-6-metoxy-1,4-benzoquinol methylase
MLGCDQTYLPARLGLHRFTYLLVLAHSTSLILIDRHIWMVKSTLCLSNSTRRISWFALTKSDFNHSMAYNMTNKMSDFPVTVEQIRAIRSVPYFSTSQYRQLDIEKTLLHFRERYVARAPIRRDDIAGKIVADVGCGYGWLAMAYAIWSDARIVAIELDSRRLEAARNIATILGIGERIDWRIGNVTAIPLADREASIVYCIEVIEHIGLDRRALRELRRVTDSYLILTTPNLFAPVIGHDTQLPFCHWLPLPARRVYAGIFGRQSMNENNLFWSPIALSRDMPDFIRISRFLHYNSLKEYLSLIPYYSPYGRGEMKARIGWGEYIYLQLMAAFGPYSHLFLHNLAGTFRRIDD